MHQNEPFNVQNVKKSLMHGRGSPRTNPSCAWNISWGRPW